VKYWPESPDSVKTYEVYRGSLTIKHISMTSNSDYDLREFELTKTELVVCTCTSTTLCPQKCSNFFF